MRCGDHGIIWNDGIVKVKVPRSPNLLLLLDLKRNHVYSPSSLPEKKILLIWLIHESLDRPIARQLSVWAGGLRPGGSLDVLKLRTRSNVFNRGLPLTYNLRNESMLLWWYVHLNEFLIYLVGVLFYLYVSQWYVLYVKYLTVWRVLYWLDWTRVCSAIGFSHCTADIAVLIPFLFAAFNRNAAAAVEMGCPLFRIGAKKKI